MPETREHFCEDCVWGHSCNEDNSLFYCMLPRCVIKKNQLRADIVAAVTYKRRKKWI